MAATTMSGGESSQMTASLPSSPRSSCNRTIGDLATQVRNRRTMAPLDVIDLFDPEDKGAEITKASTPTETPTTTVTELPEDRRGSACPNRRVTPQARPRRHHGGQDGLRSSVRPMRRPSRSAQTPAQDRSASRRCRTRRRARTPGHEPRDAPVRTPRTNSRSAADVHDGGRHVDERGRARVLHRVEGAREELEGREERQAHGEGLQESRDQLGVRRRPRCTCSKIRRDIGSASAIRPRAAGRMITAVSRTPREKSRAHARRASRPPTAPPSPAAAR